MFENYCIPEIPLADSFLADLSLRKGGFKSNVQRILTVPHSGSGVAPMSSLSGVELLGFWETGMGGLIG